MLRLFEKQIVQTGLDIGSSSIKLVQLSGSSNNLHLIRFDVIKVKEMDEYKRVLKDIAQGLSSKEVNISVSGPEVVMRYIDMPSMTDEELKSSMKFEAEKYIPFNIKDVILDCQILESVEHGKMKVLLVAAKKDVVSRRINLVEGAGLSAKIVDCDSFALANAFLLNFPDIDKGGNTALLNIGARLAIIDILKGDIPYFTRELQVGGWNFAKALCERLNLDMKAASELIEHPAERLAELLEAVKPIIAHTIEEVRLSLNYYENQMGVGADKIFLSGGLSGIEGLTDIFGESLGVECRLWDPLTRLKIGKDVPQDKLNRTKGQLAVALGLAIRR